MTDHSDSTPATALPTLPPPIPPSLPVAPTLPAPAVALPSVASPLVTPAAGVTSLLDAALVLNSKQQKKRKSKAHLNTMKMRDQIWPNLDTGLLWDRTTKFGFSTIPRTLSLIINIIDDLSKKKTGKSLPSGRTYFSLWCRVWDENMLIIENEPAFALEAGYVGERNVTTWRSHMKVLRDLGFIDVQSGSYGPNNFVLIYNPYLVIKALKDEIPIASYNLLLQRAIEIGAEGDLIDAKPEGE